MAKKNQYKPYVYKRAEELGIPVVDANQKMFVAVFDNDVVMAKKKNSEHCALARASLRIPGVVAAYFFRKTAFLEYKKKMVRFTLPQSVQKEIVSFDRAQIFASGVYQLTPPPPASTRAYKNADNKARRGGRKLSTKPLSRSERAGLSDAIEKISAQEPKPANTPEQAEFERRVGSLVKRHLGGRTVTGIKSSKAPEPLPGRAPTRYVNRTQYVRDLREPQP